MDNGNGNGGPGTLGPVGPLATAEAQVYVARANAACARGDCRYADAKRGRAAVERDTRAGCIGYAGTVTLEGEGAVPVLRWRRCPRFGPWWRAEQARVRATRAAMTAEKTYRRESGT